MNRMLQTYFDKIYKETPKPRHSDLYTFIIYPPIKPKVQLAKKTVILINKCLCNIDVLIAFLNLNTEM